MAAMSPWKAERIPDWLNLILAVLLFISPWVFGFTGETAAAWTAWVMAVVIAVFAVAALVRFAEWEEWVSLLLGIATIIAPWVVGFTAVALALWTHVVLGALVALIAAWELWQVRHHRSATA